MPQQGQGDVTYTVNQIRRGDTPGRFWNKVTLVFPQNGNNGYSTGGIPLDVTKFGLPTRYFEEFNVTTDALSSAATKFSWEWNGSTTAPTLKAYATTAGVAGTAPFQEVANTTALGANGSITITCEVVGF